MSKDLVLIPTAQEDGSYRINLQRIRVDSNMSKPSGGYAGAIFA